MRVLIVGAGTVGFYLARRLAEEAHEVTPIDPDPIKVQRAKDNLDILVIRGNGAAIPVLEEAGLADTEILMSVSGSDEVNLVACLVASKRGVPAKVARISHPEYHARQSILSKEDLGVDPMIGPEQECAWEAFGLLNTSAATEVGAVENYGWMSPPSHFVLAALMIVGRLEIFTVLLLSHPDLWGG